MRVLFRGMALAFWVLTAVFAVGALREAQAGGNAGGAANAFCRVGQSCNMGPISTPTISVSYLDAGSIRAVAIDAGSVNVRQLNAMAGIDAVRMDAGSVNVRQLNAMVGIDAVRMDAGSVNVRQLNAMVGIDAVQIDAGTARVEMAIVNVVDAGVLALGKSGASAIYTRVSDSALMIDTGQLQPLVVNASEVQLRTASGPLQAYSPAAFGLDTDNGIRLDGSAYGSPVLITVTGSDPNASLQLVPKGAGGVILGTDGTAIKASIRCAATAVDLASAATGECTPDETVACTGAATGAECIVNAPAAAHAAGSQFTCFVSAADTVMLRHCCIATSLGSCDPLPADYSARVFNP